MINTHLPIELVLRILGCLAYQERSRVRVVCKFWNRLGLEFMCPRVEVSIRYLDHNQWPPYIRVEQWSNPKVLLICSMSLWRL